jgi:hypothetical protein
MLPKSSGLVELELTVRIVDSLPAKMHECIKKRVNVTLVENPKAPKKEDDPNQKDMLGKPDKGQ